VQFRQLRYFCRIVECGSFSRAAATIHIAQPALSQQLADLEARMGVELLHRSARGVRATHAGEIFYAEATEILRELDAIPERIRSIEGIVEGSVRLGITGILGPRMAMSLVTGCREALPKVFLKLVVSDSTTLKDQVSEHELDLAIIFESELLPNALSRHVLFRQRLCLAVHPQLATPSRSISLAELAKIPLVMPSKHTVVRKVLDHSIATHGLSARIETEVDDIPSLIAAVRSGLGGAVIMAASVADIGGEDLPPPMLIEPPLFVTAALVSSSDAPLTRAGEAVGALLPSLTKRHLQTQALPGVDWLGVE
jgi:LysR family transcriptional regulator, nitrogen assimilation regulatory protein